MRDFLKNWKVSDAHVHFGECSLSGLQMYESQLVDYIEKYSLKSILAFPFNVNVRTFNLRLIDFVQKHQHIFGLLRFQLTDYHERLKDFTKLLDRNPKLLGVKFHTVFDRLPITHPNFKPILEVLTNRDLIALIHCGRWKEVSHYSFAFRIAREYPELRIIIAHMGGNELQNSREAIRLAKECPNTYLETSNCRLTFIIEEAVKRIGEDRILFGTDVPWGSFYPNFFTIIESQISDSAKRQILHHNLNNVIKKGLRGRIV